MIWQDWVLSVGSAFFVATLVPACRARSTAVPRWTSVPTATILVAFALTQWTLGLRVAPALEILTAAGWAFLALRRAPRRYGPAVPPPEVDREVDRIMSHIRCNLEKYRRQL